MRVAESTITDFQALPQPLSLQWSRNLRVAESNVIFDTQPDDDLLQWSRNLRVAESGARPMTEETNTQASMEPQLEGCGKPRTVPTP